MYHAENDVYDQLKNSKKIQFLNEKVCLEWFICVFL